MKSKSPSFLTVMFILGVVIAVAFALNQKAHHEKVKEIHIYYAEYALQSQQELEIDFDGLKIKVDFIQSKEMNMAIAYSEWGKVIRRKNN
jgi:hypothetical protein